MESFYLIVGLGNPGREYERTRHNVGFMVAELLAERWKGSWKAEQKLKARLARVDFELRKAVLCQPQTFMNLSGEAVASVVAYYKVPLGQLLVVVDDADLPLGTLRLRTAGSAGGHHGLESVEQCLGTRDYARLRVGIGRQPCAGRQIVNHVLGQFEPDDLDVVRRVLERAALQVECWLTWGMEKAMNQFNGALDAPIAKDS